MYRILLVASVALSALVLPSDAYAHEFYAIRVPNRAMAMSTTGIERPCITCHNNPDGGAGCVDSGGTAPCLNPFGMQFRANGFLWSSMLASLDADGDGFTNGQELQDPDGTWMLGQESPGNPDYVSRPGFSEYTPGATDADNDGYCYFGQDLDDNGDCLGDDENNGSRDCDDSNGAVNSGAMELCTNAIDDDCNGLDTISDPVCEDVVDRDGDGVCPMGQDNNMDGDCIDGPGETTDAMDCNDDAITIFPGNRENCFDTVDNDCDGLADADDLSCRSDADADMDGYCPVGRDLSDPPDGDCEDEGEAMEGGFDCDDIDPLINSAATEICTDAYDNDCDGDANYADSECRGFFDGDGDGYCPSGRNLNPEEDDDCIDEGEDEGPNDCDDTNAGINPEALEEDIGCTDDIDQDCDGLISLDDPDCATHLDMDGDQYCAVGFDRNDDGDCADPGEDSGGSDCLDSDANVNPTVNEAGMMCTDGLDNDCDGSFDFADPGIPVGMGMIEGGCRDYRDSDHDGWCVIGQDLNRDGNCSDPAEVEAAGGLFDAAPNDPTIYPMAPENCFDGKDNDQDGTADVNGATVGGLELPADEECTATEDRDGDGWCPVGRDDNGDGDCEDDGEMSVIAGDCDDRPAEGEDPGGTMVHPGINETVAEGIDPLDRATMEDALRALCQNSRDDDCDGSVDLLDPGCFVFLDIDGDGFCPEGIDDNSDGDCLDTGESRFASDCDDSPGDPVEGGPPVGSQINTRALEAGAACSDGVDNDCDGRIDGFDPQCECAAEMCEDDGDPCTLETCDDENRCIRLVAPECQDAGTPPPVDAGDPGDDAGMPADGGDVDAGEMMDDDDGDGCGCVAPGASNQNPSGGLLVLAMMLGWRLRRRW